MKVVCVHWGNKYPEEYVYRLKSMVERHSNADFLCLTDKPKTCDYQILEEGFEGWWNKIQLFHPDFLPGERFLYLDLDVVITDDITSILERKEKFVIIDDWIYDTYNSSAMLMTGGEFPHVYNLFMKNPEKMMRIFPQGDQQLITSYVKADGLFSREEFSSFRMDGNEGAPTGKIVVFHGRPNPHEIKEGWVPENWR